MICICHLHQTCPNCREELLCSLVFLTVDLPTRHLANSVLGPLKVLEGKMKDCKPGCLSHLKRQISVIVQVKESIEIKKQFILLKLCQLPIICTLSQNLNIAHLSSSYIKHQLETDNDVEQMSKIKDKHK